MPGCVLRIGGTFNANDVLARCPLPRVTRSEDGCVLSVVTETDESFSAQVADASQFLARLESELCAIASAGVTLELDFGVWLDDGPVRTLRFPPHLLALAGAIGIVLAVSVYAGGDV